MISNYYKKLVKIPLNKDIQATELTVRFIELKDSPTTKSML